jgi:hypothetical protein
MIAATSSLSSPAPLERSAAPTTALILLDFDNCFPRISEVTPSSLRHDLLRLCRVVYNMTNEVERIEIRAYGGWMDSGTLTTTGSQVAQLLSVASPFPLRLGQHLLHGDLTLATSLIAAPSHPLGNSHRPRTGLPRVRLAAGQPAECTEHPLTCPVMCLRRFTRSRASLCPAPGCPVTAGGAFRHSQQKMVDTHITCDLLEATQTSQYCASMLLSTDMDFFPPLLQASLGAPRPPLVSALGEPLSPDYIAALEGAGIMIVQGEDGPDDES